MLDPQVMAYAVPVPGKTFDHNASERPGIRCGQLSVIRPGPTHGIYSSRPVSLPWLKSVTRPSSWLSSWRLASRGRCPSSLASSCATLVNHGMAGALGAWITAKISPEILRWVLGASFIGMAIWTLIPDKIEEEETQIARKFGVFTATVVTFFLAEMGDKTQIATMAMAAHYPAPLMVVAARRLDADRRRAGGIRR